MTGLVYMILDLHLRLAHLRKKLLWFNGNKFHFVFEFADDGAPETNELTMSVGSLTSWNFGERVRCREYHYLLHCLSVGETDDFMSAIWKQHSEEMKLLEGNILTVNGIQCTLEFQPSADQSWISWANNELNQAATYPSPYANVHKGNMSKIGGTIGVSANNTWNPPSKETRDKHLHKLEEYRKTLKNLTPFCASAWDLSFMAENRLREIGEPRISIFANRVRPEPVHCEINGWQHLLNLIYQEGLRRNLVLSVLKVLGNPVVQAEISRFGDNKLTIMHPNVSSQEGGVGERARQIESLNKKSDEFCQVIKMFTKRQMVSKESGGCGLAFVANKIKEHFESEKDKHNSLTFRLISAQAISLAKYGYRLVDILAGEEESKQQMVKRFALGQITKALRDAGSLFNKIYVQQTDVDALKDCCKLYYNLMVLFFPESVNLTVWTIGCAIPYYAEKLWEKYKIGYGIVSLQAKESKHAAIKYDLSLSNRSRETNADSGKWSQVMRSNYVRSFYLPEHQPAPILHYHIMSHVFLQMLIPQQFATVEGTKTLVLTHVCFASSHKMCGAVQGQLTESIVTILKPVQCLKCTMRFPDNATLNTHVLNVHKQSENSILSVKCDPKSMKIAELKVHLKAKGLSLSGTRDILIHELEGALSSQN